MAKLLKTKKLYLYMYWLNSNIKPGDYSTGEEMNSIISEVRPSIGEVIPEFIENNKSSIDVQRQFALDVLSEKEASTKLVAINKAGRKIELTLGEEIGELELDKSDFGHMFDMFSRVGKDWFNNTENFIEFEKDLNDANKDKEKKK